MGGTPRFFDEGGGYSHFEARLLKRLRSSTVVVITVKWAVGVKLDVRVKWVVDVKRVAKSEICYWVKSIV